MYVCTAYASFTPGSLVTSDTLNSSLLEVDITSFSKAFILPDSFLKYFKFIFNPNPKVYFWLPEVSPAIMLCSLPYSFNIPVYLLLST